MGQRTLKGEISGELRAVFNLTRCLQWRTFLWRKTLKVRFFNCFAFSKSWYKAVFGFALCLTMNAELIEITNIKKVCILETIYSCIKGIKLWRENPISGSNLKMVSRYEKEQSTRKLRKLEGARCFSFRKLKQLYRFFVQGNAIGKETSREKSQRIVLLYIQSDRLMLRLLWRRAKAQERKAEVVNTSSEP